MHKIIRITQKIGESLICAKRACARAHSNLRAITCAPYTLMCALFKIARAQNFLYSARVWTSLKIYTHRTLMRILFSYDIFSRAHIRLNNLLVTLCYGLQPHSYFAQKKRKVGCHQMGNLSFHLSVENDSRLPSNLNHLHANCNIYPTFSEIKLKIRIYLLFFIHPSLRTNKRSLPWPSQLLHSKVRV